MTTIIVHFIAWLVTLPAVTEWLISRAKKRPYSHIYSADKSEVYMERYWLFNPYPTPEEVAAWKESGKQPWRFPISIRIHWIRREDLDRHQHDHPWNCRTIILKGWYVEERKETAVSFTGKPYDVTVRYLRAPGDTAVIKHDTFHKINRVSEDGAWTLFITGKLRHKWGFDVNGTKVPFKEYKNL